MARQDGSVVIGTRVDNTGLNRGLNQSTSSLNSFGSSAGRIATGIGIGIAGALAVAGVQAVKLGASFESSLATVSTLVDENVVSMSTFEQGLLDISNATGAIPKELSDGLYQAISAGIPTTNDGADALLFMEKSANFAKAGLTDLDTAVDGVTSVMNAYGLSVEDTDRIQGIFLQTQNLGKTTVDELARSMSNVAPIADAMNVSFEQVGASLAVLTATGTKTNVATTQSRALFSELGKEGTKASKALMEATEGTEFAGKGFKQLQEEGVPLNDILVLMQNHAEENGLSMLDLFSSVEAGQAALVLAKNNGEDFANALKEMGNVSGVVARAVEKLDSTVSARFAKTLVRIQNLGILFFLVIKEGINTIFDFIDAISANLAPALENAGLTVDGIRQKISEWMEQNRGLITTFKIIASAVKTVFESIVEFAKQLLADNAETFEAIKAGVTELGNAMKTAFIAVVQFLNRLWFKYGDDFKALWETISGILSTVFGIMVGSVKNFITIITAVYNAFSAIFQGDWQGLWDAIGVILVTAWEQIKLVFSGLIEFIVGIWNGLIEFFTLIFEIIIEKVTNVFNSIVTFLVGIWESIISTIQEKWEMIITALVTIFDRIINSAKEKFNEVVDTIKDIFNGVVTFIKNVLQGDWESAWNGIVNGFATIFTKIKTTVRETVDGAIELINKLITKINSVPGIDVPTIGGSSSSSGGSSRGSGSSFGIPESNATTASSRFADIASGNANPRAEQSFRIELDGRELTDSVVKNLDDSNGFR